MLYEQYCLFKLCKDLHNREINKPPQQRGRHLLRPPCFWTIVHCTCAVPTCKIVSRSSSQTALLSNREHGLFLLGVKHELQQQKSRARNHSARPTGNSASPSRRVLVLIHLTEKNWGRRCSHITYYPLLFIRSPNNDLRSRLGIELGTSPREGRVLTNCGNPCSFGPDGLISVGRGEGTAIYGLYRYVPLWKVWFSSSLLWDKVYKSESCGLEEGIILQETDQLVEDFSLD